jgi:hypothetical protein
LLLATGAALSSCGGSSSGSASSSVQVEILDLAGLERAVTARSGRPLILNFWALW